MDVNLETPLADIFWLAGVFGVFPLIFLPPELVFTLFFEKYGQGLAF
jgi:hypothetical protein